MPQLSRSLGHLSYLLLCTFHTQYSLKFGLSLLETLATGPRPRARARVRREDAVSGRNIAERIHPVEASFSERHARQSRVPLTRSSLYPRTGRSNRVPV